jgi:hypothetical protein
VQHDAESQMIFPDGALFSHQEEIFAALGNLDRAILSPPHW